jgi:hypothetical protein
MSELVLPVGLAHKLETAFNRNGWTLAEVDKLCEGDVLAQHRKVLLGHAAIAVPEHLIDCDANPFTPNGWKVEEHQKGGQFDWSADSVKFHLDPGQQDGKYIEGNKLRKQLSGKPVLNANVLDYLLKNPDLIPEDWKKDEKGNTRYIFFWGTIYRRSVGRLCVRYLYCDDGRWSWRSRWLVSGWGGGSPAALRAS